MHLMIARLTKPLTTWVCNVRNATQLYLLRESLPQLETFHLYGLYNDLSTIIEMLLAVLR